MPRPRYTWKLGRRNLGLGERTLVMGILNVTPDSFSDGGKFFPPEAAVAHGLRLLDEGADLLDVGGESTRPGARVKQGGVPAQEEMRRILPVIERILRERPQAILSADTYKAEVAREAIRAGACVVNDVSALRWDPRMAEELAKLECGVILMHARGSPEEWRAMPPSPDIVEEVKAGLRQWTRAAMDQGIHRSRIMLDPGFGFGKNFGQNYPLLARLGQLHELGFPLLSGTSRKSFIGRTLARDGKDAPPGERLYGSLAAATVSVLQGAHIARVHDVRAAVEAVKIADEALQAEAGL